MGVSSHTAPAISVVIPVRNDFHRLERTLQSIADGRQEACPIEVVIVDDASDMENRMKWERNDFPFPIRVFRLEERIGVPAARNYGTFRASGEIVFMTDSHVELCHGWDQIIIKSIDHNRILAATIIDPTSTFKAYGCSLVVPFMGTRWNKQEPDAQSPYVQIASCAGTVLHKSLFERLGGYDPGMILYGGAEPEFSVRAWLSGAEIIAVPELHIIHRFKTQPEINRFLNSLRPSMMHNNLRFGMLYLSDAACLQMIRHYAMIYPEYMMEAANMLDEQHLRARKEELDPLLIHDFRWFVERFNLKDQAGMEILV